jgi:DNA-damage-inducible protein D
MPDKPTAHLLAEIAWDEALQKMTLPERQHAAAETNQTLRDGAIEKLIATFEDAAQTDDAGNEFWDARDLQKLLDYVDYRNFLGAVEKAKEACKITGISVEDHFVDATDMVEIGSGATREVATIKLSRYACYLVAQNGDPRKQPIAFAQTYFAIQTRKQEIEDEDVAQFRPMPEDEKRILLRDEIKEHNKHLASAAKAAGVDKPLDYAIFQTYGYKGLYGGLDRIGIQRRKGLKSRQNILDHMGSTELAANLFRATQTEEKLRRENIKGKDAANRTHYEVGHQVREAIKQIGGTMPENLPPAEHIVKVTRRIKKAISNGTQKSKNPTSP